MYVYSSLPIHFIIVDDCCLLALPLCIEFGDDFYFCASFLFVWGDTLMGSINIICSLYRVIVNYMC